MKNNTPFYNKPVNAIKPKQQQNSTHNNIKNNTLQKNTNSIRHQKI